ncbi:hypothetical protein [Prevotella sp. KH2C16]|uniref:hypothetical protein n=1 Tax=Prevotella sp. KH2C16 TaxID=1855325 RepID=UPI0008E988A8|nr:hypothetical protein [Prevotella sp. KH2C16]SFG36510.1 hypothetical protein SAMN05216383_11155 [Prevotella sp. KH2C16]
MKEYEEIRELLTPRRDIKASAELRKRVHGMMESRRRSSVRMRWIWGGAGLTAAVVALLLLLPVTGMSAKEFLHEAIKAIREVENIRMTAEIRTRAMENFSYIDVGDNFVTHRISISNADSIVRWRVDKGGRIAVGNDSDVYMWVVPLKIGWHSGSADRYKMLGYLSALLSPGRILETELQSCLHDSRAEYAVRKSGKEIYLTVRAEPQGDFENPYRLNSTIEESRNIRRYVIDAATKRLKRASVSIVKEGKEIEVLKITDIHYGASGQFVGNLPADVHFVEVMDREVSGLTGMNAMEAASVILSAFKGWNHRILDRVIAPAISQAAYRQHFMGAELVSVGQPFHSGKEAVTYVPYTLRLRDGLLVHHNLALRKNDADGWVVDGGL